MVNDNRISISCKKLAVIFPGVGYHTDKPLLYYSKKLAKQRGYEVIEVNYSNLPSVTSTSSKEMMYEAFKVAFSQAKMQLSNVDYDSYDDILFIGKSVGTVVATTYAHEMHLSVRSILYTPVDQTFNSVIDDAIVFHGTADPWADTVTIKSKCEKNNIPLYLIEGTNHSLEMNDVMVNLDNMNKIMKITEDYIN